MALSFVAQSARGAGHPPVPQPLVDEGRTIPERFLIRWRGEANPEHVKAIDAYWISAAEHGVNASTFTARVVASTGADCAAALSAGVGPCPDRSTGGPFKGAEMLEEVEHTGDAQRGHRRTRPRRTADGIGHRVYRAEDPRARVLRRTCRELGSPRFEAAQALEQAALAELQVRQPDRGWPPTWSSGRPRSSTWQKRCPISSADVHLCRVPAGRPISSSSSAKPAIRPTAKYVGFGPRTVEEVE